jgi:hypothetical protein
MELAHRADTPIRSEAEQLAFFDAALESALEAESRVRVIVEHLMVAGTRIELRFASESLARHYLPALAHLVVLRTKRLTSRCAFSTRPRQAWRWSRHRARVRASPIAVTSGA